MKIKFPDSPIPKRAQTFALSDRPRHFAWVKRAQQVCAPTNAARRRGADLLRPLLPSPRLVRSPSPRLFLFGRNLKFQITNFKFLLWAPQPEALGSPHPLATPGNHQRFGPYKVPEGRKKVTHPFRGGMDELGNGVPEGRKNSHASFVPSGLEMFFRMVPSAKALGYPLSSLRDSVTTPLRDSVTTPLRDSFPTPHRDSSASLLNSFSFPLIFPDLPRHND